jgi:hypothetical protein
VLALAHSTIASNGGKTGCHTHQQNQRHKLFHHCAPHELKTRQTGLMNLTLSVGDFKIAMDAKVK